MRILSLFLCFMFFLLEQSFPIQKNISFKINTINNLLIEEKNATFENTSGFDSVINNFLVTAWYNFSPQKYQQTQSLSSLKNWSILWENNVKKIVFFQFGAGCFSYGGINAHLHKPLSSSLFSPIVISVPSPTCFSIIKPNILSSEKNMSFVGDVLIDFPVKNKIGKLSLDLSFVFLPFENHANYESTSSLKYSFYGKKDDPVFSIIYGFSVASIFITPSVTRKNSVDKSWYVNAPVFSPKNTWYFIQRLGVWFDIINSSKKSSIVIEYGFSEYPFCGTKKFLILNTLFFVGAKKNFAVQSKLSISDVGFLFPEKIDKIGVIATPFWLQIHPFIQIPLNKDESVMVTFGSNNSLKVNEIGVLNIQQKAESFFDVACALNLKSFFIETSFQSEFDSIGQIFTVSAKDNSKILVDVENIKKVLASTYCEAKEQFLKIETSYIFKLPASSKLTIFADAKSNLSNGKHDFFLKAIIGIPKLSDFIRNFVAGAESKILFDSVKKEYDFNNFFRNTNLRFYTSFKIQKFNLNLDIEIQKFSPVKTHITLSGGFTL